MSIKEYLLQKNISLVCKIDPKIIKKISQLTNAKIIENISEISNVPRN